MLRHDRQIKPGLVALYDIRPRNGAGLFLQPRGAHMGHNHYQASVTSCNCNLPFTANSVM